MIVSYGYELLASKFLTLYGELYKLSNSDHLNPIAIGAIKQSEKVYTKKVIAEFNPDLIVKRILLLMQLLVD